MGTRSLTIFKDGKEEIAVLYRQYDGYPTVHGKDLAEFLSGLKVTNGLPFGTTERLANGAGCLAVQTIHYLKQKGSYDPCSNNYHGGAGGLYLYKAGTRDAGEEWTYVLSTPVFEGFETPKDTQVQVTVWNGEEGKADKVFEGPAQDFYWWVREQISHDQKSNPTVAYINKALKKVKKIQIVEVDSKSNPGTKHKVAKLSNGDIVCTCKGFEHRKTCRHIKEAGF